MTTTVQPCGNDDPEDPCERIRAEIRRLVFQEKSQCGERGLRERIMDQIYGEHGPGTPEWEGHRIAIDQMKNRISNLMDDYVKKNCPGGGTPIGKEAEIWIQRRNPTPAEWKGPKTANPPQAAQRSLVDWQSLEEATGLSGIALALYLIVSEGSRLFPPRNLVPVP